METNYCVENSEGEILNLKVLVPEVPKATIVLHHGYGGSMRSPVIKRLSEVFYEAGLAAVIPDTTNSLNSSGGDIKKFTFAKHASDLGAVIEWAVEQDWASSRLHLAGYSLGGYSASALAGRRDDVASLLLVAPVFSGYFFREGFMQGLPNIMDIWEKKSALPFSTDQGRSFDAPFSCWKEWLSADALPDAENFKGNVSVITAGADSLVLPSHVMAAKDAFHNANFSSEVIASEDHGFSLYPEKLNKWALRQLNIL